MFIHRCYFFLSINKQTTHVISVYLTSVRYTLSRIYLATQTLQHSCLQLTTGCRYLPLLSCESSSLPHFTGLQGWLWLVGL